MSSFASLSKLMKIFHSSSLPFLEEQGSQSLLSLIPHKGRSHNFTKIKSIKALSTNLKSICHWPLCDLCRDLPVGFWYFICDSTPRLVQTFLSHLFLDLLCGVKQECDTSPTCTLYLLVIAMNTILSWVFISGLY